MATTIPEPPKLSPSKDSRGLMPSDGSGGFRNLVPAGGDPRKVKPSSPAPASTGIWVGLAAITMTFAAFTSALIVRQGAATDWQHFTIPSILYLNSLIIIASSVTLELSRRQIATFMTGAKTNTTGAKTEGSAPSRWLYVTLFLGLLFVAGQTFGWLQLKSQGFGLSTNISYSFFYVLTVAHAVHLLGGLGGLVRVINKLNHSVLKRSTLNATSLYWHFMGALWLYLLLLLWMKL
ncbi:MAG TPA: cytochrome c oxidase subunit 3 [Candidatus Sulfotelmatobacter sp.]|jgi:cytochrome c oxidase subunit 3|nr:cytochrome c oxidase subunit 3 [Candidatus Sulfotelmatobacter sp.]